MRGNAFLLTICCLLMASAALAVDQGISTEAIVADFNGDGVEDLSVVDPTGAVRLLISEDGALRERTADAGMEALVLAAPATVPPTASPIPAVPKPITVCGKSIKDRGQLDACLQAGSSPKLGRLYPLGQNLFVDGLGNVGVNTLVPGDRLSVAGQVESLDGGLRFPNGTLQGTATLPGSPGTQGPPGPQGPQGPQGPSGQNGITALNNQFGPALTIAGSGSASVSASGSTITVSAPSAKCIYANETYSANAVCYTRGNEVPCSFGFRSLKLSCNSNGSWQVISSSQCFNPSAGPLCGS